MLSITDKVREELLTSEVYYPQGEFYGYFASKSRLKKNKVELRIHVEDLGRVYKLAKILFDKGIVFSLREESNFQRKKVGWVSIDFEILKELFLKENLDVNLIDFPKILKSDPYKFGVFLKGVFMLSGSVSVVKNYHLEFFLRSDEKFVRDLISTLYFSEGIKALWDYRSAKYRVIIKSGKDIVNFLVLIGASNTGNEIEKILQAREVRGNVSRIMNFISANANKIAVSSAKQVEAIKIIEENLGLDALPDELKEIAYFRLENPYDSLSEIAQALGLSKSTVYSRLRKLKKIAKEIEKGYKK